MENDDGGEPKGSGRSGPMIIRWHDRPGIGSPRGEELDQRDRAIHRIETRQIRSGKDEANLGGDGRPSVVVLAAD